MIECISAVTITTRDMARAVAFYQALGFKLKYGGADAGFTSFHAGHSALNLRIAGDEPGWTPLARIIFWVGDVDDQHALAVSAGLKPDFSPRDATWGERYFHITDPDGHGLSFAKLLAP
jgi:catechol 2,3-dioxygenase-like lactoylglutathione lyase family enzyme